MSDLKHTGDINMSSYDSLRLEAETLRERIGQENVNQSSVLASRRLDEALLRLDRAAGRNRSVGRSITSTKISVPRQHDHESRDAMTRRVSSSPRTSDLELDESIAQSSSLWLEVNDEERTRYRLDEASDELPTPRSHLQRATKRRVGERPEPGVSESRVGNDRPEPFDASDESQRRDGADGHAEATFPVETPGRVQAEPIAASMADRPSSADQISAADISADHVSADRVSVDHVSVDQVTHESDPEAGYSEPTGGGISQDGLNALFASPIDVMLASVGHSVIQNEHSAIVTSVPRAKLAVPIEPIPAPTEPIVSPADLAVESVDLRASAASRPEPLASIEPLASTEPSPLVDVEDSLDEEPSIAQAAINVDEVPASPSHGLRPFQATWQVDEFIVPPTVDELFLAGSIAEQLASRLAAARSDGLHTIAVTSAKSGEGRSTVAIGMALSVAFSGLKVALVDADPHGVKLATDFQLDLDNSWLDTVRTHLPMEEAAVYSNADSLTLLPMLQRDDEQAMESTDLRRLLRKLKNCFDLVIVDCGASAVAEVSMCDTALIVRDVHRTKALEVETLAMSLRRNGLQGIGVVENFCQG